VTKDVQPYCIVAGNPARVLRFIDKEKDDESAISQPQSSI